MSLLINIDTAVEGASVCLAAEGKSIAQAANENKNDSAAWLHTAIQQLLQQAGYTLNQVKAVAVSAGPGSYTGLRVGMATAKGLCYALNIPLITLNTLQVMAHAATNEPTDLICPMIDARRMEVFTAVYDKMGKAVFLPQNIVLSESSFSNLLELYSITFLGNGSPKFKHLLNHNNASFRQIEVSAAQMAELSFVNYTNQEFANLAYSEPFYGKEFYSPAPKNIKTL